MAYTEFYMQTTGDNANSGSTTGNSAVATSTNGDWGNAAANRFTAASGTPFSGVNVNDWASIYNDGATSAVYVARVTAVNGGGTSIDLSSTDKMGTAPSTAATGKSCKVGGAWASPAVFTSLGTTTVALSTRLNVKAGTYANTTTSRNCAISGATTTPFWIRGYNAAIGDLDADFTTAKPSFTFTTGIFTLSGTHIIMSNMSVTTAAAAAGLSWSGTNGKLYRSRVENTNANSAATALGASGAILNVINCWIKATTTATQSASFSAPVVCAGTTFEGGGHGCTVTATSGTFYSCYFRSNGNCGLNFNSSGGNMFLIGCTFSSPTNDGIRIASTPGSSWVISCNFTGCGGYDMNNNTGTNTNLVARSNNNSYNTGTGHENGFGDSPRSQTQTDSASAVTSSSNPTPPSGSTARLNGIPVVFEGQGVTSYRDIGCVQHQDTGGGPTRQAQVVGSS